MAEKCKNLATVEILWGENRVSIRETVRLCTAGLNVPLGNQKTPFFGLREIKSRNSSQSCLLLLLGTIISGKCMMYVPLSGKRYWQILGTVHVYIRTYCIVTS